VQGQLAQVCRPKALGGLGILDLGKFARALRLRSLWFKWVAPDKPWVGTETPNDESDRSLFNAATRVTIGDGKRASFWSSSWVDGSTPKLIDPKIFKAFKRKNRTVNDAMLGQKWISDINVNNFTLEHIEQFIHLWGLILDIQLSPGIDDSIIWTLSDDEKYLASSAYKARFLGSVMPLLRRLFGRPAPLPSAASLPGSLYRIAYGPLAKRGWPHQPSCPPL
jgi:hypothetical protein